MLTFARSAIRSWVNPARLPCGAPSPAALGDRRLAIRFWAPSFGSKGYRHKGAPGFVADLLQRVSKIDQAYAEREHVGQRSRHSTV